MAATLSSVNLHHNGMSHLTIKNISILHKYFIAQHMILLGYGKNLQDNSYHSRLSFSW